MFSNLLQRQIGWHGLRDKIPRAVKDPARIQKVVPDFWPVFSPFSFGWPRACFWVRFFVGSATPQQSVTTWIWDRFVFHTQKPPICQEPKRDPMGGPTLVSNVVKILGGNWVQTACGSQYRNPLLPNRKGPTALQSWSQGLCPASSDRPTFLNIWTWGVWKVCSQQ